MNFTQINVDWYTSTFLFYLGLIIGCYVITIVTQNKPVVGFSGRRSYLWSLIVPFVLLFVKGFGTTGRDLRNGYFYNYMNATSLSSFPDYTVETGYRVLNVIIRNITTQYWVLVFVIACLSIYPVIAILKKYKDRIDLPAAILLYMSIFFFNGFSPLRMCLAAALGLFAFDAMAEKRTIKALIWIIIASLFHTSSLVLIIPYFFSSIKGLNKKMIAFSLTAFFLVGYLGRASLTSMLAENDRYYIYSSFDSVHIGFEQIIYFFPLFIIFYYGRKCDADKHFSILAFSYLSTAFCFGMLGYVFSIFGRFRDMFVPLIIIVPYYVRLLKKKYPGYQRIINIMFWVYCIARFYIYISQYYISEDLMPYTNIFGWVV